MTQNTKIEWAHHTANLWWGCTKVHEGCDNCYAEALDNRYNFDNKHWGNDKTRKPVKSVWNDLKKYQTAAQETGEIHRVFVGSMMDIAEKSMPLDNPIFIGNVQFTTTGELRDYFYKNVVPVSPNLMFLLLSKRPGNFNKQIPELWLKNPPKNVMFGTSPVNQKTADRLLPQLFSVNGYRFLSIEPQLGPIALFGEIYIDWVIQGGESGPKRRFFDLEWAYLTKQECEDRDIAYFFKQIDKVRDINPGIPKDLQIREFPNFTGHIIRNL